MGSSGEHQPVEHGQRKGSSQEGPRGGGQWENNVPAEAQDRLGLQAEGPGHTDG